MLNGKAMIILFNSWIDKQAIVYMSEYFQKPKSLWSNVKVELDLSKYISKVDLKLEQCVDKKTELSEFKIWFK